MSRGSSPSSLLNATRSTSSLVMLVTHAGRVPLSLLPERYSLRKLEDRQSAVAGRLPPSAVPSIATTASDGCAMSSGDSVPVSRSLFDRRMFVRAGARQVVGSAPRMELSKRTRLARLERFHTAGSAPFRPALYA